MWTSWPRNFLRLFTASSYAILISASEKIRWPVLSNERSSANETTGIMIFVCEFFSILLISLLQNASGSEVWFLCLFAIIVCYQLTVWFSCLTRIARQYRILLFVVLDSPYNRPRQLLKHNKPYYTGVQIKNNSTEVDLQLIFQGIWT